jgi:hypothetical protein
VIFPSVFQRTQAILLLFFTPAALPFNAAASHFWRVFSAHPSETFLKPQKLYFYIFSRRENARKAPPEKAHDHA